MLRKHRIERDGRRHVGVEHRHERAAVERRADDEVRQQRDAEPRDRRIAHHFAVVRDERPLHVERPHRAIDAEFPADPPLAPVQHARVASEIGRRLRRAVPLQVRGARARDHPPCTQRTRDQRRILERADPQHEVEALADQVDAPVGQIEVQPHGRVRGQEFGDQRRHVRDPERQRRADLQRTMQLGAAYRHRLLGVGDLREDALRAHVKLLPRFGHREIARIPVQQPHAERRLQRHRAPADELLGQHQLVGRRREAARIDGRDEDPQVVEFHIVHSIATVIIFTAIYLSNRLT